MRIIEMTNDPNVTPAQLTELVQTDTGLSSKILRTVNSAFYGLSTPVSSIRRAQIMLGLNAIKTLTLGFSLVEALDGDEAESFDYPAFWKRSLHAAACAKAIATKTRAMEPEEALLGGLLQDVGMVVLHRTLGKQYDDAILAAEGLHRKVSGIELHEIDITHPVIGSTLAERWRFPATLITTIRYHEQPTAAPKAHTLPVRCVGLAGLGASVLTETNAASALRTYLSKAQSWFNLSNTDAEAILEDASNGAREFAKLLDVPAGAPSNAQSILEAAKDKLVDINLEEQIDAAVGTARSAQMKDALTGAPSRKAFLAMLEDAFARAASAEGTLTVAAIDIAGVPEINTSHGREAGDAVLIEFATRLRQHFEPLGGEVARIGGESFGVLLPGVDHVTAAKVCSDAVETIGTTPLGFTGNTPSPELQITLRVGVTTLDHENVRAFRAPLSMLAAAEKALEAARGAGGKAVRAFVPQYSAAA